jgi:hypothetical protein
MQLHRDGAQLFAAALTPTETQALRDHFASFPTDVPGTRLKSSPAFAGEGDHPKGGGGAAALAPRLTPANTLAQSLLGANARPIRATFFDKNPQRNWALGWHQDRTIAVKARFDLPGFGPWTVKSGLHHTVPPFALLERMLTLRIHLDDTGEGNAPLLISPGTHRLGRIPEPEIARAVEAHGTAACLAEAGDIWVYSTPILHASDRAAAPTRRRVLQLLYSADILPPPLEWLGV